MTIALTCPSALLKIALSGPSWQVAGGYLTYEVALSEIDVAASDRDAYAGVSNDIRQRSP